MTLEIAFHWQGREDPEDGALAKRWHHLVQSEKDCPRPALASLVGFACDEGVERNKGRIGAALGPDHIRAALCNFAWHGPDGSLCDLGNVALDPDAADRVVDAQHRLGDHIAKALKTNSPVVVFGGGHETAAGSFDGLLKSLPQGQDAKIGIINFDAHFDLRAPGPAGASSGTPFFQIKTMLDQRNLHLNYLCLGVSEVANTQALFARAQNWGVEHLLDHQMTLANLGEILAKVDQFLSKCDLLYLTIDLDVLPHWQMPGVSAPAPFGVEISVIEAVVRHLGNKKASGAFAWPLADLVEYNPNFDPTGCGAKVAARLVDCVVRAMIGT